MSKSKTNPIASPPAERRTFLKICTALAGAVATAAVAIPGVSYLAGALWRPKEYPWVKLGPVAQFPELQTRLAKFINPLAQPWDGMTANAGVWVRNLGRGEKPAEQFQVFAINCTHLGCPVDWFPQSGLFMCPCHGGVYYEDGSHASGPPPRGLYHCDWRVTDGELEILAPFLPTLQHTLREGEGLSG